MRLVADLFEAGKVDVVFNGHVHNYQRFTRTRSNKQEVPYIVCGNGGHGLTNGDGGTSIRDRFRRKLLEVLFDGNPEADAGIAADGQALVANLDATRKLLVIPADPAATATLAAKYANKGLGTIAVSHAGAKTIFDFGVFKSEMASKANPDGTVSLITIAPGFVGLELVIAGTTLVIRDAQHEYAFTEKP